MPFIQAGNVKLNYVEHGTGNNIVVFIHGYLGCVQWMDLIWPRLPKDIHVFAIDWRGCGESEKPTPSKDFANYSLRQHAEDMIAAIKALGISKCGLANHSTGGIIGTYMLLAEPGMFKKVFSLDPISPRGLKVQGNDHAFFQAMKDSRSYAFKALGVAAPALFIKESLYPGAKIQFKEQTTQEQKDVFNLVVDKTRILSDGIWFGTPFHLAQEREKGTLANKTHTIKQPHLVLWGEDDIIIPRKDIEEMPQLLPNCQLRIIKDMGHVLTIENPDLYTQIFTDFFRNN